MTSRLWIQLIKFLLLQLYFASISHDYNTSSFVTTQCAVASQLWSVWRYLVLMLLK